MTTSLGPYAVHPFADAFPLLHDEDFDELVADIQVHGQHEPILVTHDQAVLVDGRNRYRACEVANIDPVVEALPAHYTEPMILDLIVSKNLARRQLTAGQKAMCSQEYERLYARAVKARETRRKTAPAPWEESGKSPATPADLRESQTDRHARESAARAARITGVSARAVQQAKAITRDTPDLAERVRRGELALDAADRQRRQRLAALPKPDPMPKPGLVMLTLRTHDGREVPYPKPTGKATFTEAEGGAAWSWSPVTGCLHGCAYCWAREIATGERHRAAFPAGFSPLFHPERLDAPAHTTIPAGHQGDPTWRRVIVCPLADLYGPWVPDEWITRVHAAMCAHGRWQYVTQTRFPARYIGLELPPGAWVGTSVDAQGQVRAAEEAARRIDAPVIRWLSLEPLREPLSFTDLSLWDWVVIGAQTETRQPDGTVPAFAPPFDWVARLVTAARDAGCRVYLKPTLLGRTDPTRPGMRLPDEYPTPHLPADTGDAAAAPPGNGNL